MVMGASMRMALVELWMSVNAAGNQGYAWSELMMGTGGCRYTSHKSGDEKRWFAKAEVRGRG